MSLILVSRHSAASEWLCQQGLTVEQHVPELAQAMYTKGDLVVGSLPAHLAAEVCECGGEYWHLALNTPLGKRGAELTVDDMNECHARLIRLDVTCMPGQLWDPT